MTEPFKIAIMGIMWFAWALAAKELGLMNILAIIGLLTITKRILS